MCSHVGTEHSEFTKGSCQIPEVWSIFERGNDDKPGTIFQKAVKSDYILKTATFPIMPPNCQGGHPFVSSLGSN